MNFEFATAAQIVFGPGHASELAKHAASSMTRPALVLGASRRFSELLPNACCTVTVAGEPTLDVVRAATAAAREAGADGVVAIGGGSALDAGKAVAMLLANGGDPLDYAELIGAGKPIAQPSLPFIAVPTTAGTGSEATRNAVLFSPEHRLKVSLRSARMLPRLALVDPDLALDLPPAQTAASGMDALAQLIEPFLSRRANPMIDALCRDGIARAARALPRAVEDGLDRDARSDMALAALYSGIALANTGLGAVHGLAGPIGARHNAPHGAVCAALLPGVFESNYFQSLEVAADPLSRRWKFEELARTLTGDPNAEPKDGAAWLRALAVKLRIPGLAAYGVRADDALELARLAQATSSMKGNPVPLSDDTLARIVVAAL